MAIEKKRAVKSIMRDMQEIMEGRRVSGEMERESDNAGSEKEGCS